MFHFAPHIERSRPIMWFKTSAMTRIVTLIEFSCNYPYFWNWQIDYDYWLLAPDHVYSSNYSWEHAQKTEVGGPRLHPLECMETCIMRFSPNKPTIHIIPELCICWHNSFATPLFFQPFSSFALLWSGNFHMTQTSPLIIFFHMIKIYLPHPTSLWFHLEILIGFGGESSILISQRIFNSLTYD